MKALQWDPLVKKQDKRTPSQNDRESQDNTYAVREKCLVKFVKPQRPTSITPYNDQVIHIYDKNNNMNTIYKSVQIQVHM